MILVSFFLMVTSVGMGCAVHALAGPCPAPPHIVLLDGRSADAAYAIVVFLQVAALWCLSGALREALAHAPRGRHGERLLRGLGFVALGLFGSLLVHVQTFGIAADPSTVLWGVSLAAYCFGAALIVAGVTLIGKAPGWILLEASLTFCLQRGTHELELGKENFDDGPQPFRVALAGGHLFRFLRALLKAMRSDIRRARLE